MSSRRSEQYVALCSSNMDVLILYAGVVPLFAMILVHQLYASSSASFVDTIHRYSILTVLSPVNLRPIISRYLESIFSLPSAATSIKTPSASELVSFCHIILTQESLGKLVSSAQWATDKLFTCEISYMITVAMTSLFNKFFHVTYLRISISTASLLVTVVSTFSIPTERDSLHAARQQFKYRIYVFCCIIFSAIDYATFVFFTVWRPCSMVQECRECCECQCKYRTNYGTWVADGRNAVYVAMIAIGFCTIGTLICSGAENFLESWKVAEAAREEEEARLGVGADVMERASNAMRRHRRFMQDDGEEQVKEEALREIVRLYEADDTLV